MFDYPKDRPHYSITEPDPHRAQRCKDQAAFDLRAAGLTYQQIADQLGVNISTAYRRVRRLIVRTRHEAFETRGDVRDIDLAKLSRLERSLTPKAVEGDLGACRLAMQAIEMRKKYLADVPPDDFTYSQLRRYNERSECILWNEPPQDGGNPRPGDNDGSATAAVPAAARPMSAAVPSRNGATTVAAGA